MGSGEPAADMLVHVCVCPCPVGGDATQQGLLSQGASLWSAMLVLCLLPEAGAFEWGPGERPPCLRSVRELYKSLNTAWYFGLLC